MITVTISSSALAAARALRSVNSKVAVAQSRVDSKLKVASAKDGVNAWTTATLLKSQMSSYNNVSNGLDIVKTSFTKALIVTKDVSSTLTQILDLITAYKTGTWTSTQRAQADAQLVMLQKKIGQTLTKSWSNGQDYLNYDFSYGLNKDSSARAIAAYSFNGPTTSYPTIRHSIYYPLEYKLRELGPNNNVRDFTLSSMTSTSAGQSPADMAMLAVKAIKDYIDIVDKRYTDESNQNLIEQNRLKLLSSIKNNAVKVLINANMKEEEAKLEALKSKQQIARTNMQLFSSIFKSNQAIPL